VHFGLRGRIGSILSKRVAEFQNHQKRKSGPGRSWNGSGHLKNTEQIFEILILGSQASTGGLEDLGSLKRRSRFSTVWVGSMAQPVNAPRHPTGATYRRARPWLPHSYLPCLLPCYHTTMQDSRHD